MWSWIKESLRLTRADPAEAELRIEERQRRARKAVAEKQEKEGRGDLELGKRTGDAQLVETGRDRLRTARMLRSDEVSLFEALGLYESHAGEASEEDGGSDQRSGQIRR